MFVISLYYKGGVRFSTATIHRILGEVRE